MSITGNERNERDQMAVNILILSAGTRDKVVQYFVRSLAGIGSVTVTDCSALAPAIYDADRYYIVPRITEPGYIEIIYDICRKEKISGVFSLIDPELSLLAQHEEDFRKLGVTVIGSSYELCERSLDKFQMYNWLREHGYNCARSFVDFDKFRGSGVKYPVFVKPVRGSASISIAKADDEKTARFLFDQNEDMMVQEFLDGQEIGADVYIDLISGETVSVFTKKKLRMRAGETDKSVSFKDPELFELIRRFVSESGYRGQIDIDIFDINGKYYISEVNPRFGGGYPHAYECGCDHVKLIAENLQGRVNKADIGAYEEDIYMMKYNEVSVRKL